jgi:hypothetical protein
MPSWIHLAAAGLICAFSYIFTPGMHGAGSKPVAIASGNVLAVNGFVKTFGKILIEEKVNKTKVL